MMSQCEYRERLSAYMDGELSDEKRAAVEKHLAGCQECAEELEELRRIARLLRTWDAPQMTPMALRRVHQSLDAENFGRLRRWALSLSSVAASLALVTMLWAYQQDGAVQPAAMWEQVALSPEATRVDETGTTGTEEVAMAQWVLTDLAAGGADHD